MSEQVFQRHALDTQIRGLFFAQKRVVGDNLEAEILKMFRQLLPDHAHADQPDRLSKHPRSVEGLCLAPVVIIGKLPHGAIVASAR